jgi:hypothetical protein
VELDLLKSGSSDMDLAGCRFWMESDVDEYAQLVLLSYKLLGGPGFTKTGVGG